MPTLITIEGNVPVLTDKGLRLVDWLEYDGRAWIADLWIVASDGKSQRPLRIIAPRFAPGFEPIPGPSVLQFFQTMQVPESLLEQGFVPSELAPLIEVRENPDIYAELHYGMRDLH